MDRENLSKNPAEAGATLRAFSALRCCGGARDHDAEHCWTRCGVHWQQPGLGVPWSASGDPAIRELPCLGGALTDGVRCSWLAESRRALLAQHGIGFSVDGIQGEILCINGWMVDRSISGHLHRDVLRIW